ncbi:hypothetical protein IscW_ISCW017335 [Ixodes scapularis]|uniref:Uncharacterized protein n=1 Tax=Ixodes scapularis TaxID=6945 RepID=B7P935_IXOSC|nr:hypothetical protein IscW_ISCW017335 [Ixodes scapularis]|eukprot:XP_002403576.1 hypothetical protein IscW_ISCW017335 [Ixodes scapularis]
MLALANSNAQSGSVAAVAQSFQAAKKLRTDGDLSAVFANGEVYDESVDKTTLLLNCLRQQMTDSAGRAQTQAQTPLANGRPESAGRNDAAAMSPPERRPTPVSTHRSMAPPELAMDDSCYMSLEQNTCDVKHSGTSYAYEAAAAPLVAVDQGTVSDGSARGASMEDSPDEGDSSKGSCCREDLVGAAAVLGAGLSSDVGSLHEAALVRAYDVYSMEALLRNIQTLLRVAADGARHHERQMSLEKVLYQRRLRRERRSRRKVQEQLQDEVKRRLKFEETLRENSAEAVRFLSDALDTKDGADTQFRLDAEQKMHDCAMSLYAPEAPRCGSPGR